MASKHGGARKGAGRKVGSVNKSTAEFKELAGEYSERALEVLGEIIEDDEAPHASRVAAVKEIFDRAYGKATQAVDVTGDMKFTGLEVIVRKTGD